MDMKKLAPAQLKLVMDGMQQLRERLAIEAQHGVAAAGFGGEVGARNLASMMACIGAAQLLAATDKKLYSIFRLLCVEMAQGTPESVMMRKLEEMGPEMFGGDIMPPKGIIR